MTRVWKLLTVMIGGAALVWLATMAIHSANAEEKEAGPKWKIVVILEGPPGKQELTYGNQQHGVHWFASQEECEAARKGGDKDFAKGIAALHAQLKAQKVPVEVTTACVPDSSI